VDLEALRYLYLRHVVGPAISLLGVRLADGLARRLGRMVHALGSPARQRAEARAASWLGDASAGAAIVSDMYEHAGRFCVEALFAPKRLRESTWRSCVSVSGERELQRLAESPKGCLLATAYYGSVGVLAWSLGQLFRPVHVVADRFDHPALRAWQRDLYSQPHVRIIERREASRHVPAVIEQGGAVLLIAENERPRGPAVAVEFLGRALRCYPTLPRLSRWFDVPVAVVTCRRKPEAFRFDLRLHGVVRHDERSDDEMTMREIMARLEGAIRAAPEQYWWPMPVLVDRLQKGSRVMSMSGEAQSSDASSLGPQVSSLMHTGT
jgi:lauroyl/myristoyl acyltransferase